MAAVDLMAQAGDIAADRDAGAAELLARLLPVLEAAIEAGEHQTRAVARVICHGQPAMAALWNACALALAEFVAPGRFAHARAAMARAPQSLTRLATAALADAFTGDVRPQVLTLSCSSSVAAVLSALARERAMAIVCGESLPGGEGHRLQRIVAEAGAEVTVVADALLTTYLAASTAVVVGADAISARDWTNKAGTFGLAAAASFTGTPVFVIASRDKAQSARLRDRIQLPRAFERIPIALATLVLTDAGPVSPEDVPALAQAFDREIALLLPLL